MPYWERGIFKGRTGKKADEEEFEYKGSKIKCKEYWRIRHGITFVRAEEELVYVFIPAYDRTLSYPESCVFRDYERGTNLPEFMKKSPQEHVQYASSQVERIFNQIIFCGKRLDFSGPVIPADVGYAIYSYDRLSDTLVNVGGKNSVHVDRIAASLKMYGPYSGPVAGKLIVIYHGNKQEVQAAVKRLNQTYTRI